MSQRQWKRLDAVERLRGGELHTGQAAQVLGLSERQVRRVRRAVEKRGAQGVIHGNTGRAPTHRIARKVRERIVKLRAKKYEKFNDHHFTEKFFLTDHDQLVHGQAGCCFDLDDRTVDGADDGYFSLVFFRFQRWCSRFADGCHFHCASAAPRGCCRRAAVDRRYTPVSPHRLKRTA